MKKSVFILLAALTASCNTSEPIVRESHGEHPSDATSSRWSNRVEEYMPAPGQFINGTMLGFTGAETSAESAAEYAHARLEQGFDVSLGGFGGYIVVGFDHSIQTWGSAQGGYDFSITGNQFNGSSEPGAVWVKQDVNGNGTPDDNEPWYEIRGSEYGNDKRDYSVTYFRPSAPGEDIAWTDSEGLSGIIERQVPHKQDSYYPSWRPSDEESYTLSGTCLPARDGYLDNGRYFTGDYEYGYADNRGSDMMEGSGMKTFFCISDAVDGGGSPAQLQYIDFIKVQTAVNIQGGAGVGELSTEVCRFTDENLEI
jgi:hypothetical protein